ncbi:MAG: hypothetical protein D6750_11375 [Bacteroidetes bacterium]|nr:MAG: hypothetical protein D6750_11375 [Bacteroidota bacterium]
MKVSEGVSVALGVCVSVKVLLGVKVGVALGVCVGVKVPVGVSIAAARAVGLAATSGAPAMRSSSSAIAAPDSTRMIALIKITIAFKRLLRRGLGAGALTPTVVPSSGVSGCCVALTSMPRGVLPLSDSRKAAANSPAL